MRTSKQIRQPRPSFREIQKKWRIFRFASTLLPLAPGPKDSAAIEATRINEHCIEVISDSLKSEGHSLMLQVFTLIGLLVFFSAVIAGVDNGFGLIWLAVLGLPAIGLMVFFLFCVLGPRFRYRCSKVRFDRRSRCVYYVPYPEESSDEIWELDWDQLQGICWSTGQAQPYLYLVGYTRNLPAPQLVKIPIMSNEKIYADHIWAWLNRYMAKVEGLPPPKIVSLPQSPRDVLLRYGGRWIIRSFTARKWRRWLPLMIWVDLAILLVFMPSMALPHLIILQYPEIEFPEENSRRCGFSTG